MERGILGRPKEFQEPTKKKVVELPVSLANRVEELGIIFGPTVRDLLETYIGSDDFDLARIEREIKKKEAELAALRLQYEESKRLKQAADQAKIREKVESLIPACVLRNFVTSEDHTEFRNWKPLFTSFEGIKLQVLEISSKEVTRIRQDIKEGRIKPDSPIEEWGEYEMKCPDNSMRIKARKALIEELTQRTRDISEEVDQ